MGEWKLIPSFEVDHDILEPGIYVSRRDFQGDEVLTTFDIRLTKPNVEPAIDNPAIHSMEHIGATFLRNHDEWGTEMVYFGPMWCRTGFYGVFKWDLESKDILPIITDMIQDIIDFEWKIPGCGKKECGNYLDHNLEMAKFEARRYLDKIKKFTDANLKYAG